MTEEEQRKIFSANLVRIMESQKKTQADMVRHFNISKSTASNWYNGIKLPRMGKIDDLCTWLDVHRSELLESKSELARSASPDKEPQRYKEAKAVDDTLNDAGHVEWIEYGRYLAGRSEYRHTGNNPAVIKTIRDYFTPSAAGYAEPAGDDYEDIPLPDDAPVDTDFSVHVKGVSMMPYLKDGQRVYVKQHVDMKQGDVGVFFYDGATYIKMYGPLYDGSIMLLSANPDCEDQNVHISKDSNSTLICFGKVLLDEKLPAPVYKGR